MTTVYFATNRAPDPTAPGGFSSAIVGDDPMLISYAVADVPDPPSGNIGAISDVRMGRFSAAATDAITGSGKSLFVFIHGFDNSFSDALSRAAFNTDWLRGSGNPAADCVAVAFVWPSFGQTIGWPPEAPYKADQLMAGASGFHLGHFFNEINRLRAIYRVHNPGGKIFLIAHSMGNWALQAGMTWWFNTGANPVADMFDEVILAAPDEVYDSFETPDGSRLAHIAEIAVRVTIYSSRNDQILNLAAGLNGIPRLGQDGPKDKTDPTRYPINVFRIIDCTAVNDYSWPFLPLRTHQYYRLSPTVRSDIAAVVEGTALPIGGLGMLPPPSV